MLPQSWDRDTESLKFNHEIIAHSPSPTCYHQDPRIITATTKELQDATSVWGRVLREASGQRGETTIKDTRRIGSPWSLEQTLEAHGSPRGTQILVKSLFTSVPITWQIMSGFQQIKTKHAKSQEKQNNKQSHLKRKSHHQNLSQMWHRCWIYPTGNSQ